MSRLEMEMIHVYVRECPDFMTVERTFWERWFTLPWTPKTRYKTSTRPYISYLESGAIVCSPLTATLLKTDVELQQRVLRGYDET